MLSPSWSFPKQHFPHRAFLEWVRWGRLSFSDFVDLINKTVNDKEMGPANFNLLFEHIQMRVAALSELPLVPNWCSITYQGILSPKSTWICGLLSLMKGTETIVSVSRKSWVLIPTRLVPHVWDFMTTCWQWYTWWIWHPKEDNF